eukprot:2581269-Prymnesium_polylepis.1
MEPAPTHTLVDDGLWPMVRHKAVSSATRAVDDQIRLQSTLAPQRSPACSEYLTKPLLWDFAPLRPMREYRGAGH